ncbi:MAG: prolipoprotein diacylglyceryl transferase, partial [Candidatus Eisenbacteria bacterium]|nr:prolipoprotein diacylglyceryl transferase [Candidatus Eisenbacteria bacterium]
MHPEVFQLGALHLRSYGLMMAIAFVVGTFLGLREARRLSLDEDKVVNVILVTLIASVFGARMLYVLEHLSEFRREWTSVLALWQGGLTLYGGVAAGTFAGLVAAKRMNLPVWITADALTPSLALGTMFGRVGCYLNGCCYGRPTNLPWGVVFPHDSFAFLEFGQQPVHPSQIYNALAGLVLFILFQSLRKRFRVPGVLFWSFIVLFALVRIPLDMTRTYEADAVLMRIGVLDFTESQLMSAGMILFGSLMILRLRRQAPTV